jgi:hypothetical protein
MTGKAVYNRQQWVDSFEGQLSILRPHLSQRLLSTMSLSAWHSRGTKGDDPIKAAKASSKALDAAQSSPASKK